MNKAHTPACTSEFQAAEVCARMTTQQRLNLAASDSNKAILDLIFSVNPQRKS